MNDCMLADLCKACGEGCTQDYLEEYCQPVGSVKDLAFILVRRGQMYGLKDDKIWKIFQRVFPSRVLASE